MVFNSLIFLFIYFPLTFLLYNILPGKKIKNYCLLLCSLLFYAWDNPTTLVILILLIIWNWVSGIELENLKPNRRKAALIFTVVVNLLPLCFFKYLNFILGMNI